MATVPAIGMEMSLQLSKFKAELASMGPEAGKAGKQITAELSRQWKAQQREMAKATAAAKEASAALKGTGGTAANAGTQFDKLGAAMGPLGGILSKISPEAGEAASSIAAMTSTIKGAAEGLGVGMAALTVAVAGVTAVVAVLAAAYVGLTAASREQAEIDAIVEEGMKGVEEMAAATARNLLELDLVTRGVADADAARELALFDVAAATDKATKSSRDLIEANEKIIGGRGAGVGAIDSWATAAGQLSAAFGDLAEEIDKIDGGLDSLAKSSGMAQGILSFLTGSIDGLTTSSAELRAQNAAATGTIDKQTETINKAAAAALDLKEAQAAAAKATKAAAAGAKAHADETKAAADAEAKAAEEAAKWAHELALLRDGADMTELGDALDKLTAAQEAGAITAEESAELQIAAFSRYESAVEAGEAAIRAEQERTAKDELARIAAVETARRDALTDYQRQIEDTTAKLKKAGWGDIAAKDAATMEASWQRIGAAAAPYLELVDTLASAALDQHTEALAGLTDRIETINGLLAGLSDTQVNAATLSGEALVDAYQAGEVAAEDLSTAQRAAIKRDLEAQKAAAEKKAAVEKEAALLAFGIQKATAISGTIVAGLQGAIAAFQLGPIAGAIAAVAIGALTATNVGLIASEQPSFASGGFIDAVPTTGISALVHPNEAVLNQRGRAALGDDAIRDANNGTSGGQAQVNQIVYKHRAFEYFVADHLNTNGTLAKTIRRGDRVGQLRRGRA